MDISAGEYVEAQHSLAGYCVQMLGTEAAALVVRGQFNPNKGKSRHDAALRLGDLVGSAVMGKQDWEEYIKTSAKRMPKHAKPFTGPQTRKQWHERPDGHREGWIFKPAVETVAAETVSRWSMTDEITYRLPNGTEFREPFRAAISQAYHANWERYVRMEKLNQRDKDAGKLLPRGGGQ